MKKTIINTLFIAIPLVVIGLLTPGVVRQHNISKLQNLIEEKRQEIAQYSGLIEELQAKHDACSTQQQERHNSANAYRTEQTIIEGQIQGIERELASLVGISHGSAMYNSLMSLICEKAPLSPLCGDNELLEEIKNLPHYETLIGISYAESHIGSNFSPHFGCKESNNWGGLKWAKYSNGDTSEKYNEQYKTLSEELQGYLSGCYLYYFETPLDYFKSLSNTVELGYLVCDGDPACINESYVGHFSQDWIDNVNVFIKN